MWRARRGAKAGAVKRQDTGRDFGRESWVTAGVRFIDGGRKALVSAVSAAEVWDVESGRLERKVKFPAGVATAGTWALTPDETRLVIAGTERGVTVVSLTGEQLATCTLPEDAPALLLEEEPALGTSSETLYPDGRRVRTGRTHPPYSTASGVAVAPDGATALAAYGQTFAVFWDLRTGRMGNLLGWRSARDLPDGIYRVALSPDGELAATLHARTGVRIWSVRERREIGRCAFVRPADDQEGPAGIRSPSAPIAGVGCIAFSPDSRSIAIGDGAQVRRFDLATGSELAAWVGHREGHPLFGRYDSMPRVHDIRFSADGRRGLTVGVDSSIRVWDVATGRQIWGVIPKPCCIDWADIAPDGRHVIWAACPGLRVYEIPPTWEEPNDARHA